MRYENGCLTPDMGSVFIALDPAVKENGCLQVSLWKPLIKRSLHYKDLWQNNNAFAVTVTDKTRYSFTVSRSQLVAVTDQHHTVTVCLSTTPNLFCEFPQFFAGFSRQSQNGKAGYPADRFGFDKKIF